MRRKVFRLLKPNRFGKSHLYPSPAANTMSFLRVPEISPKPKTSVVFDHRFSRLDCWRDLFSKHTANVRFNTLLHHYISVANMEHGAATIFGLHHTPEQESIVRISPKANKHTTFVLIFLHSSPPWRLRLIPTIRLGTILSITFQPATTIQRSESAKAPAQRLSNTAALANIMAIRVQRIVNANPRPRGTSHDKTKDKKSHHQAWWQRPQILPLESASK